MRASHCRSGEGAPRHTTLATRPPRGCGVSGRGPRAGGLAGRRVGAGRWGCTALQRAQDRPAALPMGHGSDEAPRPLLTHRAGFQGEGTNPLAQSSPAPARRSAAGPDAIPLGVCYRRRCGTIAFAFLTSLIGLLEEEKINLSRFSFDERLHQTLGYRTPAAVYH